MRHLVLVHKINITVFILHGSMPRNIVVRQPVGKYCPFRRPKLLSYDTKMSDTTALIQRNVCGSLFVIFFCSRRVYHVYTSACFSSEESRFGLVSLVFVKNCRTHWIFVCAGPRLAKFKWKFYRFSQSRYSCITSDWGTDTLCISWVSATVWNIFVPILYI